VRETEGHAARFRIDIAEGKASATASNASADLLCSDKVWAAIVLGELAVATAVKMELVQVNRPNAIETLGAFCDGPVPFCSDGF
jgi:hypothetical protein